MEVYNRLRRRGIGREGVDMGRLMNVAQRGANRLRGVFSLRNVIPTVVVIMMVLFFVLLAVAPVIAAAILIGFFVIVMLVVVWFITRDMYDSWY